MGRAFATTQLGWVLKLLESDKLEDLIGYTGDPKALANQKLLRLLTIPQC